uniref:Plastid-encoded RNA polymerase subunit alpha n=1 Tax=Dichotomosiphon tuberosus TaxID=118263 RepID=A0A386AWW0_9CHLO|nr:RNA polymerase a-subunit [Dichotomosiphon tuberosus]
MIIYSCIESRIEKNGQIYGLFKLGPFEKYQSLTIANILRRTLLADESKIKINAIQIKGVNHEYMNLKGVRESIIDILLNFEKLIFKDTKPILKPEQVFINFKGPKIITAKDIKLPKNIQCVNLDNYLMTLEFDGSIAMKLFLYQGKGGSHSSLLYKQTKKIRNRIFRSFTPLQIDLLKTKENFIFLENSISSINKVNYSIQPYIQNDNNNIIDSVNFTLNQEILIFEIWTNGSIHPKNALIKAIDEVLFDLIPFRLQNKSFSKNLNFFNKKKIYNKLLNLDIGNLDLCLENYIYLKKQNINRIIDILNNYKKLKKNYNSFKEIQSLLLNFGLVL